MSVLIKGMKMPRSCWECPLFDDKSMQCLILRCEIRTDQAMTASCCPLVEVPTPHRDLIDRDELKDYATIELTSPFAYPQGTKQDDEKQYREMWDTIRKIVIAAPTVIEGEA